MFAEFGQPIQGIDFRPVLQGDSHTRNLFRTKTTPELLLFFDQLDGIYSFICG
jgi:hypothetical protein